MADTKTHFADDATLAHIAKLERENADLRHDLGRAQDANTELATENAELAAKLARARAAVLDAAQKADAMPENSVNSTRWCAWLFAHDAAIREAKESKHG